MDAQLVDYPAVRLLANTVSCLHTEIGPVIGQTLGGMCAANPNVKLAGSPRVYYLEWAPDTCKIQIGVPVGDEVQGGTGAELVEYPAGTALAFSFFGPYSGLAAAWEELWGEIQKGGYKAASTFWDDYVTDPGGEPDESKWHTDSYIAVEIPKL